MARKLKTYQTSLGFFDQAIATPSMKAALEAWGADSNLFHQGAAIESHDPDVIAATMAKPKRFAERHPQHNMPNDMQAGVYASVLHYLKAVDKVGGAQDGKA